MSCNRIQYKFKNHHFYVGSCKHSDLCVFSPSCQNDYYQRVVVLTNNKKFKTFNKIKKPWNRYIKNYWDYDIKI